VALAVLSATLCQEAVPTDDAGRCALPAVGPALGLTSLEEPWLARPLPWVRSVRLWWDLAAVHFLVELALLWWLGGRKTAFAIGVAVVLIGVGASVYLLHTDRALKHAEQHYALADWYGVLAVVAGVPGALVGCALALMAVLALPVLALRKLWQRRAKVSAA
jgi:hypothetical protein